MDSLEQCFENNCINGTFLCYGCLLEYLDDDTEDFSFLIKELKLKGLVLDEMYVIPNDEVKQSVKQNFLTIVTPFFDYVQHFDPS